MIFARGRWFLREVLSSTRKRAGTLSLRQSWSVKAVGATSFLRLKHLLAKNCSSTISSAIFRVHCFLTASGA